MNHTILLLSVFICAGSLFAEPRTLVAVATFDGTSTLHDFTGSGTSAPAKANWTRLEKGGGLLTAEGITFDVKSLTTDHKKRDKKMMKMFDPSTHPRITGDVKDLKLVKDGAGKQNITLHINGKTLTVPVTITTFQTEGDAISFSCSFSLSLKEAGLKRPSVLGLIRVGDTVALKVDATLTPPKD